MIEKFSIDFGANEYAVIQEPNKHEDERQQLISEGYQLWAKYFKDEKLEELWIK